MSGELVLVADDDDDILLLVTTRLKRDGYEVVSASSGDRALELAQEHHPRIAVLDIGMPGINGYDVARDFRARYGEGVMLIALTGWGQEADRQRSREAGFDHHLTKPVEPAELEELIARAQ